MYGKIPAEVTLLILLIVDINKNLLRSGKIHDKVSAKVAAINLAYGGIWS